MDLSDPFGRMKHKRAREYEALRQTLLNAGINDQSAALVVMARIRQRAIYYALFLLVMVGVVAQFFPQVLGLAVVFGVVLVLWGLSSARNGQSYVAR